MLDFEGKVFERSGASCNTSGSFNSPRTTEEIMASIKKAEKILDDNSFPCLIKIWRGEGLRKARRNDPKKLRPKICLSAYVSDNILFLCAGVGIVAGAKAYAVLRRMRIILQWSDDYIPLEDQTTEAAKVLLKWADGNQDA